MDGNKIGVRIMQLRDERGESQEDVAKGIGESRETIRNWEVGTRKIKAESIVKLSQYFGVTSDYLLGLSDIKSTEKNVQIACDVTGLSEDSILALEKYDTADGFNHIHAVLDSLFSDQAFFEALSEAERAAFVLDNNDAKNYIDSWNKKPQSIISKSLGCVVLTGLEAASFRVQRAAEQFKITLLANLDSIAEHCNHWVSDENEE